MTSFVLWAPKPWYHHGLVGTWVGSRRIHQHIWLNISTYGIWFRRWSRTARIDGCAFRFTVATTIAYVMRFLNCPARDERIFSFSSTRDDGPTGRCGSSSSRLSNAWVIGMHYRRTRRRASTYNTGQLHQHLDVGNSMPMSRRLRAVGISNRWHTRFTFDYTSSTHKS